MKHKKLVSIILMLCLFVSLLPLSAFAAEEVFDVSISEEGSVTVKYSYPYYRNSDVSFVISENSTQEIIYFEQYKLNNLGTMQIEGISLPHGGEYTISIYPENRGSVLSLVKTHFSEQDRLDLWNIAATSTDSEEISDNWFYIESVLGFSVPNLDYVISDSDFFAKIASQRTGDHSAKTEENFNALTEYFNQMALWTAFEQNTGLTVLKDLFSLADFTVSSDAQGASQSWNEVSSDGDYNLLADIFAKKQKSIASMDDLISYMLSSLSDYRVQSLLDKLNRAKHISQVSPVILSDGNAEILGISSLVDSYKALDDTSAVDSAVMGKGFTSKEAFYAKFSEALTKALEDLPQNPQDTNPAPSIPDNPGSSWMGSSSGGSPVTQNPSSPVASCGFSDLGAFPWAKEHINMLYSLGIISGKSATKFAPADNITREEIAKLIVCLFKLESTDDEAGFADVAPSAWYEPYVCAAAENGIAQGIGNNMFGIGMNASRQDICVMLANALKKCGFDASAAMELSFEDQSEISSYARSAVESLCAAGIITGDSRNRFNPQSYATRAETAVMISRIYTKYIKEGR